MKYNPFRPGSIVTPGMFVGRLDESNTIQSSLFQTKNGNPQHFLIQGERGIGKSSLLLFINSISTGKFTSIMDKDKMAFLTLSVDMGNVFDQQDIVKAIARELKTQLADREKLKQKVLDAWNFLTNWEVLGVKYRKDTNNSDRDDAREDLASNFKQIFDSAAGDIDGIFVIIDEADRPEPQAGLGEFLKLFTERLAKKGCNNVIFGIAGLPSVIQKLKASHESSPRLFEILNLDPLSPSERQKVVNAGLNFAKTKNQKETKITPEALELISELSEGYPHFIQEFSYAAFAVDDDDIIDINDVKNGAFNENGALSQLGIKYFNEMYHTKISSEEYRKVLNAMAAHGDNWVSRKSIIDESGVSTTNVANALSALKDRKIIMTEDGKRGYYRLPTKSFAAWINAFRAVKPVSSHQTDTLL